VIIRVCIDETYSHENREEAPLMVSGCVSSILKWELLDRRWAQLLRAYGLKRMHLDEILNRRGEFGRIPPAKLVEVVEKFEKAIFANVKFGFSTVLYRSDFDRFRDSKGTNLHTVLDSEYGVSIRVCYGFLDSFVPGLMGDNSAKIHVLAEGGHANEGAIREIYREYRRPTSGANGVIQHVEIVSKDECYGTQAADMRGGMYLMEERSGEHAFGDIPAQLDSAKQFIRGRKLPWFRLPINEGVLSDLRDSIILSRPKFRRRFGHLLSSVAPTA
jgi:hypothetical protein